MRQSILLILLFGLLGGCSQMAQQPLPPLSIDPQQVQQLQQWSAEGRIGIRWSEDSQSANLDWQQTEDRYQIRVSGPLGQGGIRIEGNEQMVSLQRSGDDQLYLADSPEALMQQLLGWQLPLSQAQYWIRGIPAPGNEVESLSDGQFGFIQSGWQIEYPRLTHAAGIVLPEKLRMTRDDLRITVIINTWERHDER
ncbi:lipoprotein insertase outer membrane protein LolB [Marinobacterium sediminicola]|uniref:Outer-membrane lipoprotein LolB n=1 Tax=Marinobacterium sediminicola TaxID=518898 RepID=A0ABY1S1H3_9GAMM|nr:lipoprotein insertase outer membrane protein LolB [Marinobacterium sediminicola]ULG69744.1 lipoprotein insertase outer membrane protein LolB [Marinobacterium sediminicola]SMR75446.1 outer membrane lipoprotein LolB [Marinobacterium sediminicola]